MDGNSQLHKTEWSDNPTENKRVIEGGANPQIISICPISMKPCFESDYNHGSFDKWYDTIISDINEEESFEQNFTKESLEAGDVPASFSCAFGTGYGGCIIFDAMNALKSIGECVRTNDKRDEEWTNAKWFAQSRL